MKPEHLLAEIEDVLRSIPERVQLRHVNPENIALIGRIISLIGNWKPELASVAREHQTKLYEVMAAESLKGYTGLLSLLNEARSDLRLHTVGPVSVVVGHGQTFDYFDEIRKQIALAAHDLLFVDPYLDADFVGRYLPHVRQDVSVRLLSREKLPVLIPAVKLFSDQYKMKIEVRSAATLHDRFMIVDGKSCFQSGASFKDGGRTSPTTITQITDAFPAVKQTYDGLWAAGKVEFSV